MDRCPAHSAGHQWLNERPCGMAPMEAQDDRRGRSVGDCMRKSTHITHTAALHTVDDSIMLAIPQPLLDALRLSAGSRVRLTISDGRLLVDPIQRPRYTLDELLAQCGASAELSGEDRKWLGGRRAGEEEI